MEHGKKNRKFGREKKQRQALMSSLAQALILHGRIKTTQAKAKSLKIYIEKLMTKGKKSNLASFRRLLTELDRPAAQKLFKELAPRFIQRSGGYTRVRKLPRRQSDGAEMAIIEFVGSQL